MKVVRQGRLMPQSPTCLGQDVAEDRSRLHLGCLWAASRRSLGCTSVGSSRRKRRKRSARSRTGMPTSMCWSLIRRKLVSAEMRWRLFCICARTISAFPSRSRNSSRMRHLSGWRSFFSSRIRFLRQRHANPRRASTGDEYRADIAMRRGTARHGLRFLGPHQRMDMIEVNSTVKVPFAISLIRETYRRNQSPAIFHNLPHQRDRRARCFVF